MSDIDVLLFENRKFPPPHEFRARAIVSSPEIYEEAARDPEGFWAARAGELEWSQPWDKVLDWKPPHAQWFVGGKINASVNCVDRHAKGDRKHAPALIWEGEPGDERTLTYATLYAEVNRFANGLRSLGVTKGDRVAIYLPMIPEAAMSMLACARIGAIHSVVFGGFSPESLRDRINDSECKVLITADGGYRRGQITLGGISRDVGGDCAGRRRDVAPGEIGRGSRSNPYAELSRIFRVNENAACRPDFPKGIPLHDKGGNCRRCSPRRLDN